MQRRQNVSRGGQNVQGVLQLVLARVQSSVSNAASLANLSGKANDLEQMIQRGPALTLDDLPAFVDALKNLCGAINDREFLLEKVIVLMSRLPDDSAFSKTAQQYVINLLYKDLPHPPSSFLSAFQDAQSTADGDRIVSYAFRSADGSNYNVLHPSLGRAGQPYARSVPSTHIPTLQSLPDAGVVFDTLLRRRNDDFVSHPGGLSSLFFAFADLIIHNIFHTNNADWTINNASSYLDLSIIYGSSPKQVHSMRRNDGSGKIWNDAFADSRLLLMPPSVCALAVLFSRHHNYVAENILNFNEHGSYNPSHSDETSRLAQDDEIFNRARLVNTAFFMQVILRDYVGGILGLVRDGLTWRLDPLAPFRESDHAVSPRGDGNAVSVEFNLLYRWHASISEQDEKWLDGLFRELLGDKDPETMSVKDFGDVVRQKIVPSGDVKTWTFDGLKRGSDGRFADQDIARRLQDATEHRAGAFRARGCPAVMRVIEMLAIEQGRKWKICTLNEFRKFIGLRPYESFREWNPDPEISSAAKKLYGHIDNLELHVGLQAEETKPPIPGAGLCPGFTISRAILADAVCLTRGDRFLTVDYTPHNLTSWGYQHCMVNTADGSYGGMLPKLLFLILPDQYPADSVYAHFPFMNPDFMRTSIQSHAMDQFAYYDWSRPAQFDATDDTGHHDAIYQARISKLTKGMKVDTTEVRKLVIGQTLSSFEELTRSLLKKSSTSTGPNAVVVDVVKDVINRVPLYWAANFIVGLPITMLDGVWGGHTPTRWVELFADVTKYLYFNDDPLHDWPMYQAAVKSTDEIVYYLHNRLKRQKDGIVSVEGAADVFATSIITSNVQNGRFLTEVLSTTKSSDLKTLAYSIFAETVPSALLFSAAISFVVDYYADRKQKKKLKELIQLCNNSNSTDDHADDLMKFIENALTRSNSDGNARSRPAGSFVLGKHQFDLLGQRGLMSWELFSKVAPQMIRAIFSFKSINFSHEPMEFDGELPSSRVIQAWTD